MNFKIFKIGCILFLSVGFFVIPANAQVEMMQNSFYQNPYLSGKHSHDVVLRGKEIVEELEHTQIRIPLSEKSVKLLFQKLSQISNGILPAVSEISWQKKKGQFLRQIQMWKILSVSA